MQHGLGRTHHHHLSTSLQNAMTRYLIHSMQRISNLQSDVASTPASLGELDHDFRCAYVHSLTIDML